MTISAVPLQTVWLHGQTLSLPDNQTFLLRVNLATLGVLPGTGSPALASLIKYFCTWLATWFKEGMHTGVRVQFLHWLHHAVPAVLFWCQEHWQSSQTSSSLSPLEDECEAAPQTEPATRGT